MSEEAVVDQVDTPVEDNAGFDVGAEPVTTGPADTESAAPETETDWSERFQELESKYEADQKRFENAQQLITRQGQELGQLRSLASQQKNEPQDSSKFLEDFANDPQRVLKEELARREQERSATASQQELAALQLKQQVLNYVPDFENQIAGIQDWYKEKGASEDFVSNLQHNIYSNVDTAVALSDLIAARNKISELEKQITDGRSSAEARIDKMQEAAKRGRTIGAKSGGAVTGTRDMSSTDVTSLSDSELKAKLAELTR